LFAITQLAPFKRDFCRIGAGGEHREQYSRAPIKPQNNNEGA
jgi:hypothetical protein